MVGEMDIKLFGRRSSGLARGESGASVGQSGGFFARLARSGVTCQPAARPVGVGLKVVWAGLAVSLLPRLFLGGGLIPLSPFRLTRRAADVGESPRFLGISLNDGGFPFLSLALARRS